jgi:uncharacterized membrane protein YqjE
MAQLEKHAAAAAPARQAEPQADLENLPTLFSRLGDDVMSLVDAKLGLIKVELKEDVAVYTRGAALIAVGAILATVGFVLANVALAFLVSQLFSFEDPRANYAAGFVLTGVLYLVVGGLVALLAKKRMAAHDPTPRRTLEEIRKDKQWLKNEI